MKILVLTSDQDRHKLLVKRLNDAGHTVMAWAEKKKKNLNNQSFKADEKSLLSLHKNLLASTFNDLINVDNLKKVKLELFEPGCFKDDSLIQKINAFNPDIVLTYGCGIVSKEIIDACSGNVYGSHQGLPQYYRGSGSNFFAYLNREASFMGVSMHVLDAGIDTGFVVKQKCLLPTVSDTYYTYSSRLIIETINMYLALVEKIENNSEAEIQLFSLQTVGKLYQRKHFTPQILEDMLMLQLTNSFYDEYHRSIKNNGTASLVGL